ncbi:hypothetical protein GTA08_BOTSDO13026 [Botryosphaeria dothidea]|uniref:SET domain-containing protein n=1 Tax=Botryosphaeria dothidea TaxID=55169 RepID=A0A8H4J2L4_9PEZI|nr:hypothetical protein GTA08_BOTSDO13026 [Botryosphaeria dothidea]
MHAASVASFAIAALASARDSSHPYHHTAFSDVSLPFSPSYLQISQDAVFGNQETIPLGSNYTATQHSCPQNSFLKAIVSPWTSPPRYSRGIALLTTPSRAAEISSLDAFAHLKNQAGINLYSNPPFEERELPGRGKGLVANRTLNSGDRIFASTPILIIDEVVDMLKKKDRLSLSYYALENLPAETQKRFWALAAHTGEDAFDDRVDTNAFGIEIADTECWAVFPEIARLNHDCRPNGAYFFDHATLTQHVHIAANIVSPGTELTISYLDTSLPRRQRQAKLQHNWGFPCSCSTCTLPEPLSRASDGRLKRIGELTAKLRDWRPGSEASVSMALALVELVELEQLRASMPDAYVRAALQCSAQGDKWGAVRWASKAVQTGLIENGFSDGSLVWARMLVERPEDHWSWRMRVDGGGLDYVEDEDEE